MSRSTRTINYFHRVKGSGASSQSSSVCSYCYREGKRVAFFGVELNGGNIMGGRDIDRDFQKKIWQAAQKHLKEVHGKKIVKNRMGGWYVTKIGEEK